MKYHRIMIQPSGKHFFVKENETLLEAGLRQGVAIPYSCQEGECATCMARLLKGSIDYPALKPLGITASEIAAGEILTCCAVPVTDCTIRLEEIISENPSQ